MRKSLHIFTLALVLAAVSTVAMAQTPVQPTGVVNINTADPAQLILLPRVGEKAAERIIAYRTEHGPFKKASDLMQVKGFGAKTFELVSPYIAVEGKTTLYSKVRSSRSKTRTVKPSNTAD